MRKRNDENENESKENKLPSPDHNSENRSRSRVRSIYIDSSPNKKQSQARENTHGILIPSGFGDRGIEWKILAINYTCKNK